MDTIKVIETTFDGVKFRSRSEARHVVLFKAMDVRYEYEVEGFDLGADGYYLPDFWLPDWAAWLEVKGQVPTVFECGLCARLSERGHPVVLVWGQVGENAFAWSGPYFGKVELFRCDACKQFGYTPRLDSIGDFPESFRIGSCACGWGLHDRNSPAVGSVISRARSARFEHGQSG